MAEENLILKARELVLDYANRHLPAADEGLLINLNEIHVIHTQNVIGNWTMLITTSFPSGFFYEVVFDNFKGITKLSVYTKTAEIIKLQGEPDGRD